VGATSTLQERTHTDYPELETMMMVFVDHVRAQCTSSEPLERLRQIAAAHVCWRLHNPQLAEVFDTVSLRTRVASLPEEHRARIRAIKRIYVDELRAVLNAGARNGTFDFADVRVTAFALVTLLGSAHEWFDPAGDLTVDQVAEMYADLAAAVVRAPMRLQ
jgi:AcrR family transcriptional regulator